MVVRVAAGDEGPLVHPPVLQEGMLVLREVERRRVGPRLPLEQGPGGHLLLRRRQRDQLVQDPEMLLLRRLAASHPPRPMR